MEKNVKIEDFDKVSDVISFIVIKKLMTSPQNTEAFKLGLIDSNGAILKQPESEEEHEALTLLDKFIFKLKRLLGTKLSKLNNFLYVQTLGANFLNNVVIRGGIEQRAVVKRVKQDIERIKEKYDLSDEDLMKTLMYEEIVKRTDYKGNLKLDE